MSFTETGYIVPEDSFGLCKSDDLICDYRVVLTPVVDGLQTLGDQSLG